MIETNEVDMKIVGTVIRVVCLIVGIWMVVAFFSNLNAWHQGDPEITNIWQALGGTRSNSPLEFWRRPLAKLLWIWSPDGVLTAIYHVLLCFSMFEVGIRGCTSAYLRWGFLLLWV